LKNFFEQQKKNKQNSFWLILLFLSAAVFIIWLTQWFFGGLSDKQILKQLDLILYQGWDVFRQQYTKPFNWIISFAMVAIILSAVAYKYHQLKQGGAIIATQLGAELVLPNTYHPLEKQLINIVEEIAIAAHTSVPHVYLLKHHSNINAFAAGNNSKDAIIGITRGALEKLTRDEIQAVVAHEFSHIVNGDIRLNNRLTACIFGISFIGLVGEGLINHALHNSKGLSSKNNPFGFTVLFGLFLVIYGLIGTLLADMIKAAICRQREYLADATATQFNRNPDALASALQVISGLKSNKIKRHYQHQYSHLFFTSTTSTWLNWFSTHPPLLSRIKKLNPSFNNKTKIIQRNNLCNYQAMMLSATRAQFDPIKAQNKQSENITIKPLINNVSNELIDIAHEPKHVISLSCLLILSDDFGQSAKQLKLISKSALIDLNILDRSEILLANVSLTNKFKLIEIAISALHCLNKNTQKQTTALLLQVINLGDKNQISAWAFYELLTYQLVKPNKINFLKSQKQLLASWRYLISIMAHFGSDNLEKTQLAYSATASAFKVKNQSILSLNELTLVEAKVHLDCLAKLPIKNKNALLHALEFCAKHDKNISENETILLYVLSTRLELPCLVIE
jgi:Zn-dependent protease with chaperone function